MLPKTVIIMEKEKIEELIIIHALDNYFSSHKGLTTWNEIQEMGDESFISDLESGIAWEPFEDCVVEQIHEYVSCMVDSTKELIRQIGVTI
jgi:hypothetical protein